MKSDLMTAIEVAEFLRVDVQRVYELARSNHIPFILIGKRQYRFSHSQICRWLSTGGNVINTSDFDVTDTDGGENAS